MNPFRILLITLRRRTSRLGEALTRRMRNRFYLYLAAFFSLLVLLDASSLHLASNMRQKAFDLMVQNRLVMPRPDPEIVIVDVNEASLAALAGEYGRWPWPRQVFGEFLEQLEKQQPKAVVFDILFSDADVYNPDSDAYFNQAVAGTTNTYFPLLRLDPSSDHLSQIKPGMIPGVTALPDARPDATMAVVLPYFEAILSSGRTGTHNIYPDKDGIVREYRLFHDENGWKLSSLPLALGKALGHPAPDTRDILLNWRGKPFTYRYVTFSDVFNDLLSKNKQRPADEFKGKIVLLGSTAPSLFDIKATAMAKQFPGVEILATTIDNIKHNNYLHLVKGTLSFIALSFAILWVTAFGFFKNVELERFDKLFGASQFLLLGISYASINFTTTYLDFTGPVTVAFAYYSVARIYAFTTERVTLGGLLDSQITGDGARRGVILLLHFVDTTDDVDEATLQKIRRKLEHSGSHRKTVAHLRGGQKGVWALCSGILVITWTCPTDNENDYQEILLEAEQLRASAHAWLHRITGEDVAPRAALADGTLNAVQQDKSRWRILLAQALAKLEQPA